MVQKEQLFSLITDHLLSDDKPSIFLTDFFRQKESLTNPFPMIGVLKNIEQSPIHHPEGSVWNHTMLVVDFAASLSSQSKDPRTLMWAALLHDIGKAPTTRIRKGKITSYDHDKAGAELAREFLSNFSLDDAFVNKVVSLVRYHMHILFVIKNLPFQDRYGLIRDTDIDELALLGYADRMGRLHVNEKDVKKDIQTFKALVSKMV